VYAKAWQYSQATNHPSQPDKAKVEKDDDSIYQLKEHQQVHKQVFLPRLIRQILHR
jgi:hypothetical protein